MNVLVTGAGKHTLAIVRSLGKLDMEIGVISSSSELSFYSKYCKNRFKCSSLDDEDEYISFLEAVLKKYNYDILIPVGYRATQIISKNKEKLSQWVKTEVADNEKIEIALNKKRTYELANNIGIPCPETIYPKSFEDVEGFSNKIKYPVVIKGIQEAGNNIVDYAYNSNELIKNYSRLCNIHSFTAENLPMIQEYINGNGYGFFALYQHGLCKRIFMHKRIREFPVTGGASVCAQSFYDSCLKDYGLKLLDNLGWHGVVMVEFKGNEKNHDYKLMEINPKFWGSLDLAIAAGVNFPYYLVQMAMGEDLSYSEEYSRNLRYHWTLSGDIQHILKKPSSSFNFLCDVMNAKVKSNLDIKDPKPNMIELVSLCACLMPKSIKRQLKRFLR